MSVRITRQILHSMTEDQDFVWAWTRMRSIDRTSVIRHLELVERRRRELIAAKVNLVTYHRTIADLTKHSFAELKEVEFRERLASTDLIQFATNDMRKRKAYEYAEAMLSSCLDESVIRFYGGIKENLSIQSKIALFHAGWPLDLADVIRFRFVFSGLRDMLRFCVGFANRFELDRCRDYFKRPRFGPDDLYRALHFTIPGISDTPIEVQVLSANREAVGLIDHSLFLKKSISFMNNHHRAWLMSLSQVSNIVDGERNRTFAYAARPASAILAKTAPSPMSLTAPIASSLS